MIAYYYQDLQYSNVINNTGAAYVYTFLKIKVFFLSLEASKNTTAWPRRFLWGVLHFLGPAPGPGSKKPPKSSGPTWKYLSYFNKSHWREAERYWKKVPMWCDITVAMMCVCFSRTCSVNISLELQRAMTVLPCFLIAWNPAWSIGIMGDNPKTRCIIPNHTQPTICK